MIESLSKVNEAGQRCCSQYRGQPDISASEIVEASFDAPHHPFQLWFGLYLVQEAEDRHKWKDQTAELSVAAEYPDEPAVQGSDQWLDGGGIEYSLCGRDKVDSQ